MTTFGRIIGEIVESHREERHRRLRLDLTHCEYAEWFLSNKIEGGTTNPEFFMNDFVLFRIGYHWPRGAKWTLDQIDIQNSDFHLSYEAATDLVDFAKNDLSDGVRKADWYVRLACLWYTTVAEIAPQPLIDYLTEALFIDKKKKRGRKRSDQQDRDLLLRAAQRNLILRGCTNDAADKFVASAVNMTPDAVRKVRERTPVTPRESRLWSLMEATRTVEDDIDKYLDSMYSSGSDKKP